MNFEEVIEVVISAKIIAIPALIVSTFPMCEYIVKKVSSNPFRRKKSKGKLI